MMNKYVDISYRYFGGIARSLKTSFSDIRDDLHKANMTYTIEEYLSVAIMTSSLTFMIEALIFSFVFALIGLSVVLSLVLSLILSLAFSAFIFFLFYTYTATISKSRSNKISKILPFSTAYMAALSSSKLQPVFLFKTISKFKEYGEVAKESDNIVKDVEMFGMNLSDALKRQAKRTPSKNFREILWGINTVITSGGDLSTYLKQKSNEMMTDYRRRIRKYSQDLSLFVEIYLTLIITGSIFFIVLTSIISALSGGIGTIAIQSFVVFILLPLISIGFILLVKSISPIES